MHNWYYKNQLHHEKRIEIKIFAEFLILIPKLKFQDKNNLKTVIKYQWYCRIKHESRIHKSRKHKRCPRGGIKMANSSKWHTRWKPRRYDRIYYSKCVFSFHWLRVLYTRSFIPVPFFKERNRRLNENDIGSWWRRRTSQGTISAFINLAA